MTRPPLTQHAEDELTVRPGRIHQGRAALPPARPHLWWEQRPQPRQRQSLYQATRRGGGKFFVQSPRRQRVLVKATLATTRGQPGHGRPGSWFKHGAYLQREGAQGVGRGLGFDAKRDDLSLSQTLAQWQRDGDRHLLKLVVSPEYSPEMHLRQFARGLLTEIERDLGTTLHWVAIDHYNTSHPHLHIAIRGRDQDGRPLYLDRDYLHGGIQERARELATRTIGMRTRQEIAQSRERAVGRQAWTELDETLRRRMDSARQITLAEEGPERLTPHERRRLEALTTRGLAWRDGERRWELSRAWEQELKTRGEASARQHDRERAHEQGRHQEHHQARAPGLEHGRGDDDQQRQQRLAQILDLEHDLGWDR